MAANVYPIPDATEVNIFRRNYPYTTAITDQPPLTLNIFSDLQVLGFKDSTGTLKKCLVDASGAAGAIDEAVFFADSNGEATTSSDLIFDGTELYVRGEQVLHGPVTVANPIVLVNSGHTATINLSSSGVLSISIDGIEQVNWSNGGPE